jgi:hypothetical protein
VKNASTELGELLLAILEDIAVLNLILTMIIAEAFFFPHGGIAAITASSNNFNQFNTMLLMFFFIKTFFANN